MADSTMDFSGITLEFDQASFINAVLPRLVAALASNPTLLKQLTASMQSSLLQYAKRNGNALGGLAGGNMSGKSTGTNQTSGKSR